MIAIREYMQIHHLVSHFRITEKSLEPVDDTSTDLDTGRTICPACTGSPSENAGVLIKVSITVPIYLMH